MARVGLSQVGRAPQQGPVQVPRDGYLSSAACRSCHPENYSTWHASYHRAMTQRATPEAVVASPVNVQLELEGEKYGFQRRGEQFWVELPDGESQGSGEPVRVRRPVVLTTGSHHLQTYWFWSGKTRKVELFPFAYLIGEGRWVPEKSTFLIPPSIHPSTQPGRWNQACIQCHTTQGRPRLLSEDHMDTEVAEFGIACEACHGPGQQHVARMNDSAARSEIAAGRADTAIVHPGKLPAPLASQVCGQCHSTFTFTSTEAAFDWMTHGFSYRPGQELTDSRFLIRYNEDWERPEIETYLKVNPLFMKNTFWPDGMIRVTGREHTGLLESPCFRGAAFSCLSCHSLHKSQKDPRPLQVWANDLLKAGMDSDEACLQCHQDFRTRGQDHSHHPEGSPGSRCYNCHMPHTTYGLLKGIRSNQINTPDVSSSLRTGRPNACNHCHLDRTLDWSAKHLRKWYQIPAPELSEEQRRVATSVLDILKGDAADRALAAWAMGWEPAQQASGTGWMAPYLGQLLEDPYDAVRFIAHRSLRTLPAYGYFEYNFVGPEETRREARKRAQAAWTQRRRSQSARSKGSALLIDERGELQRDRFQSLLEQRDDRPISLGE